MEKSKIVTIAVQPDKEWQGKALRKRLVILDNSQSGTITLFPDDADIAEGQEIEYEMNDRGYGNEIKIKKESTGGGFGGGKFKPNPKKEALISSTGVLKSLIDSKVILTKEEAKLEWIQLFKMALDMQKEEE